MEVSKWMIKVKWRSRWCVVWREVLWTGGGGSGGGGGESFKTWRWELQDVDAGMMEESDSHMTSDPMKIRSTKVPVLGVSALVAPLS
jgi:hypothetical protein